MTKKSPLLPASSENCTTSRTLDELTVATELEWQPLHNAAVCTQSERVFYWLCILIILQSNQSHINFFCCNVFSHSRWLVEYFNEKNEAKLHFHYVPHRTFLNTSYWWFDKLAYVFLSQVCSYSWLLFYLSLVSSTTLKQGCKHKLATRIAGGAVVQSHFKNIITEHKNSNIGFPEPRQPGMHNTTGTENRHGIQTLKSLYLYHFPIKLHYRGIQTIINFEVWNPS